MQCFSQLHMPYWYVKLVIISIVQWVSPHPPIPTPPPEIRIETPACEGPWSCFDYAESNLEHLRINIESGLGTQITSTNLINNGNLIDLEPTFSVVF